MSGRILAAWQRPFITKGYRVEMTAGRRTGGGGLAAMIPSSPDNACYPVHGPSRDDRHQRRCHSWSCATRARYPVHHRSVAVTVSTRCRVPTTRRSYGSALDRVADHIGTDRYPGDVTGDQLADTLTALWASPRRRPGTSAAPPSRAGRPGAPTTATPHRTCPPRWNASPNPTTPPAPSTGTTAPRRRDPRPRHRRLGTRHPPRPRGLQGRGHRALLLGIRYRAPAAPAPAPTPRPAGTCTSYATARPLTSATPTPAYN